MLRALVHVITPPTSEPITLAEAKSQLRLETALDDDQVTRAIKAARQYIEEISWRGLVTQTLELVSPAFPVPHWLGFDYPLSPFALAAPGGYHHHQRGLGGIELPRGNLVSVGSVKYTDPLGVQQTLVANTDYVVDTVSVPGRVRLAFGKSWPESRQQWDAVKVQYVVGWAVADVPEPLKQAMLLLVSHFYENRSIELPGRLSPLQFSIDSLMGPYSLKRYL